MRTDDPSFRAHCTQSAQAEQGGRKVPSVQRGLHQLYEAVSPPHASLIPTARTRRGPAAQLYVIVPLVRSRVMNELRTHLHDVVRPQKRDMRIFAEGSRRRCKDAHVAQNVFFLQLTSVCSSFTKNTSSWSDKLKEYTKKVVIVHSRPSSSPADDMWTHIDRERFISFRG